MKTRRQTMNDLKTWSLVSKVASALFLDQRVMRNPIVWSRKLKKTDTAITWRVPLWGLRSRSRKKGRFRVCYHGYRKIISLFHVSRQSYHSRFTNFKTFRLRITENKLVRSRFTWNPLTAPLRTQDMFSLSTRNCSVLSNEINILKLEMEIKCVI